MMKPKADSNDSKILKSLREIVSTGNNKECFDCGQKGVTYVNMTVGSFCCTTCSGILRGLALPHRVKSISMAKFTTDELDFLRAHGNEECAKTWLGLWDTKRTIKQEHRDFMVDKYEKKRYYLEPASPLKSISTTTPQTPPQQQQQQQTFGRPSPQHADNIAVLKSIQLTPPAANNRHHNRTNHMQHQNGNANGFTSSSDSQNNNNFFSHQNGTSNGNFSSQNGSVKSDNSDFVADFSKVSMYNSSNSLNSTESGKITNGPTTNGDLNANFANFADFEHNEIYNAQEDWYKTKNNSTNNNSMTNTNNTQWNIWQQFQLPNRLEQNWSLPMTKSSLSNSLNSSGGTFNSNSSLNSTPSADRYAALKDLDEQLRDGKSPNGEVTPTEPAAVPVNPFKNPFQSTPQNFPQQQQSYQNWIIPESQSPFNGFGSPLNTNGFSHGFYYNNNMANGIISQPSAFGAKGGFGNPFAANGAASANNPFL